MKKAESVGEYLANIKSPQKAELERIRKIVKQVAPDANELISYGMPGFKYRGKYLIGYGAFKNHLSLFPTSKPVEVLKDRLNGYQISKGTIRFSSESPLPVRLIKDILAIRLKDILDASKT